MVREIRITIDDDEIFERMKHRKNQLDLSWEDVLRRGFRFDRADRPHSLGARRGWGNTGRGHSGGHKGGGHRGRMHDRWFLRGESPPEYVDHDQESSEDLTDPFFDVEIGRLRDAEDALLRFDSLDSELGAQVPLRVTFQASADGLTVDVAAVRQGQSVSDMNQFTGPDRKRVVRALVRGETAELRLTEDEAYRVIPVLSWSTDPDGHPTVVDVEITDVLLENN